MADERDQELKASQTPIQIREGAGLEEARYNVEFIEWLRKWSGPLLVVIAVVAGGYALRQNLQGRAKAKIEAAFSEYEAARQGTSPNPDSLVAIADQYSGVGAIAYMARLDAADVYLDCVRRGIKPGASVQPDGTLASVEDELKESERDGILAKAREHYQWVVDKAGKDPVLAIQAIGGLYGLAAVAESKSDNATAKTYYERIIAAAEAAKFPRHVTVAKQRIASLETLATLDPIPLRSSVPKPLDTTPAPPAQTELAPSEVAPLTSPMSELKTDAPLAPPTDGLPTPVEPAPANPAPPKR